VLIEYCTGLILVCTVLLVVATSVTIKNYWLLRELTSPAAPGRHDAEPPAERAPDRRREEREPHFERYDSGPPVSPAEWTGAVTPYTPAGNEQRANKP
jgi:hypothetical protein